MNGKMSRISVTHYIKLVKRGLLLVLTVALYLFGGGKNGGLFGGLQGFRWYLLFLGALLLVEMILRLFPQKFECAGCRKHLKKYYMPKGRDQKPVLPSIWRTVAIAGCWILLNAVFGALYYFGVIDAGVLVILSVAYSVCDMICILFFCPFQTLFLKNRCCATCRIYNWDFLMMATPLFFVPSVVTGVLCAVALVIFLCWEISYYRHPERFSDKTNACISCEHCKEKLCHHKKHLRYFWKTKGMKGRF